MSSLGWIYLLPSNAANVLVRYHPKWVISCVLPAEKRDIEVKLYDKNTDEFGITNFEIEAPNLIVSHSLVTPWAADSKFIPYFSLFAIDLDKSDGIYVCPYRLSNIYSSGKICFGGVESPANLRQANNLFWSSPFNEDNCPYYVVHRNRCDGIIHEYYDHFDVEEACECFSEDTAALYGEGVGKDFGEDVREENFIDCQCQPCRCECCMRICGCGCNCDLQQEFLMWLKNYKEYLKSQEFVKKTSYFCGRKYFAYPKNTTAIFLSNNQDLLQTVPASSWRKDCHNTDVIIGIANKQDTKWEIDIGSYQFQLDETQLAII